MLFVKHIVLHCDLVNDRFLFVIINYRPEGVRIDGIDNRTDHIAGVLSYPVEEWQQPALSHLAVRVQECEDFSRGLLRPQQATSSQERFGSK